MSTEQPPQEPTRSTIVSRSPGLAYERMRDVRPSHFSQSLARKLTVQGGLLAALAASLALALATDSGAGAGLAYLAAGGGALVAAGVTAHVGVGAYRLCWEPLTEREALALVTVEDAASYLGVGTGGLLVAATVLVTVLAMVTGTAIPAGTAPATGVSTATAVVATGATTAAVFALTVGRYLRGRLPRAA